MLSFSLPCSFVLILSAYGHIQLVESVQDEKVLKIIYSFLQGYLS